MVPLSSATPVLYISNLLNVLLPVSLTRPLNVNGVMVRINFATPTIAFFFHEFRADLHEMRFKLKATILNKRRHNRNNRWHYDSTHTYIITANVTAVGTVIHARLAFVYETIRMFASIINTYCSGLIFNFHRVVCCNAS